MTRKREPCTFTPKQALELRIPLVETSTGGDRRGAFGLFTLADLRASLDTVIGRLTEDHAALCRLIQRHGPGQLIAECGLSDAELSQLITMTTRIAGPARDTEVRTPI